MGDTMIFTKSMALIATLAFIPAVGLSTDAAASEISSDSVTTYEVDGVAASDGSTVFTTENAELTVLPSTDPQPSEDELKAMAPSVGCGLNVQNVHPSSHVNGTINGVAVISCNVAAGSLTLHYSLIRESPNYKQWAAGSVSRAGVSSLQNNRAVSCSEGPANFRGWAQGEITPPAGYVLEGSAINKGYGPLSGVACGDALTSAAVDGGATTTVTFVRADLVDAS